ncbi:S45A3 protein, partial [Leucopsar rothschildi]|nr:S45A3 protein [Leucopsar rothschildi]
LQSRRSQLLLVNSLTFGLEVCLAAGITYVPPLLLEVGVEEKFMTMVLGIGPVLGLVFVPLIGSASDHWHSSYGRRRPFIWVLCLGVLLSLFVIPHASSLASLCALNPRPLEIAFLILGIGLLDFCGQVCFTPLEALLSDLFQEPDNCRHAFSMYAFMISLGGCIGYLLPAIDWAFLAPYLGRQESCLFTLLALIFLGCVLATLFVTEEAARGDILDGPALKDTSPKPSPSCWQLARGSCVLQGRQVLQAARNVCSLLPRLHGLYCRIPRVIRRLFVAELCSWMALMTFMLFYTDFVGEGLYHGVPRAKPGTEARRHYDEGVRMGSLGLFLQCITSIFFSTIMDRLVKHFGTRAVYLASVVFFPGAAFVMCLSHSVTVVTISAALTGFTFSALQILPYTLASLYHHDKQVFLHKYKRKEEEDAALLDKKSTFSKGLLSSQKLPYQNGHTGSLFSSSSSSSSSSSPPAVSSSSLCVPSSCDVSLRIVVGEPEPGAPGRGICLDLAILDSAFLLSQVVPSLFMGSIVQFTQSVTAYMVSAAALGLVAIYFATKVVFDKGDMAKYSV